MSLKWIILFFNQVDERAHPPYKIDRAYLSMLQHYPSFYQELLPSECENLIYEVWLFLSSLPMYSIAHYPSYF